MRGPELWTKCWGQRPVGHQKGLIDGSMAVLSDWNIKVVDGFPVQPGCSGSQGCNGCRKMHWSMTSMPHYAGHEGWERGLQPGPVRQWTLNEVAESIPHKAIKRTFGIRDGGRGRCGEHRPLLAEAGRTKEEWSPSENPQGFLALKAPLEFCRPSWG